MRERDEHDGVSTTGSPQGEGGRDEVPLGAVAPEARPRATPGFRFRGSDGSEITATWSDPWAARGIRSRIVEGSTAPPAPIPTLVATGRSLTIEREGTVGEACLARLSGEVDRSNVDAITRFVEAHRAGGVTIVIDARRLTFIGTIGLAALLAAREACQVVGGDLVVRHPPRTLQRLLGITGHEELAAG